jgi:hypothetical protein
LAAVNPQTAAAVSPARVEILAKMAVEALLEATQVATAVKTVLLRAAGVSEHAAVVCHCIETATVEQAVTLNQAA